MSEDKPKKVNNGASLLFAEKFGYLLLPNTGDYRLCHEFRNGISKIIQSTFYLNSYSGHPIWEKVAETFQDRVLKRPVDQIQNQAYRQKGLLIQTCLNDLLKQNANYPLPAPTSFASLSRWGKAHQADKSAVLVACAAQKAVNRR